MNTRAIFLLSLLLISGVALLCGSVVMAWNFHAIFLSASSHIEITFNDRTMRKEYARVTNKEAGNGHHNLILNYAAGGRIYSGILAVSEREFNGTSEGKIIPVFYDVDNPGIWNRLTGLSAWLVGGVNGVGAIGMLFAAFILLYIFYKLGFTSPPE